ncbi:trypsin-like peptidase domain-containing protein [Streptomyces sp. NPDC058662]|uniref:nSTAND1 domain-containing NTPase n=1 Tax=Streptomyces sp. NPDC058662 TaxID=3346583 RepID=UPI003653FF31
MDATANGPTGEEAPQLLPAVAQIVGPDDEVAGAGFLVADDILVTCAHVVRAAATGPGEALRVDFPHIEGAPRTEGVVLAEPWRDPEDDDVAVVRLTDAPTGAHGLPLGSASGRRGHPVRSYGFPAQAPVAGHFGYGTAGDLIPASEHRGPHLQLTAANDLTTGFSGGPVVDEVTGLVIGMLTEIAAPDEHERGQGIAYVTPTEVLREAWPALTEQDVCPYRGLEPFTAEDDRWFEGRKEAVRQVLANLADQRVTLLLGPSGSGKSSLVQAGVLPALAAGALPGSDTWLPVTVRPRQDLLDELERGGLPGVQSEGIVAAVSHRLAVEPGRQRLVLIVDQFEELLTQPSTGDQLERRLAATEQITTAVKSHARLGVLLIMRDDFYPQQAALAPKLLEAAMPGLLNIPGTLSEEDLNDIITEPARNAGARFERGLPEQIINDVLATTPDGVASRRAPVTVLPLLELALSQLWQRRHDGYLTHDAYRRIGGVTGSLTTWCDTALEQLPAEHRPIAQRILTSLVRPADPDRNIPAVRRQVTLRELRDVAAAGGEPAGTSGWEPKATPDGGRVGGGAAPGEAKAGRARADGATTDAAAPDAANADAARTDAPASDGATLKDIDDVLAALTRQRIITTHTPRISLYHDVPPGLPVAELIHDALIRDWPTLREWVGQDHRFQEWLEHTRTRHSRFAEDKDPGDLLAGTALAEGLEWSERRRLPGDIAAFLGTSKEHQQTAIRRSRRLNRILASLLALALIVGGLALWQWREVETEQEEASSRQLASQSSTLINASPDLAALLAIRAYRTSKTFEAEESVRNAAALPLQRRLDGHTAAVRSLDFSPDGKKLVTSSDDASALLWDVNTGGTLVPSMNHDGIVGSAAFSPDGQTLATGSQDGTARLWEAKTGDPLGKTMQHQSWVNQVAFHPDEVTLATASFEGSQLWDADGTPRSDHDPMPHTSEPWSLAFSPDGRSLATATDAGTALLQDVKTADYLGKPMTHAGAVYSVAFSPDGELLATAGSDTNVVLWDVRTRTRTILKGHGDAVYSVAFSPDGETLATGSADNQVFLWDRKTGALLTSLVGHTDTVLSVAFSPDGSILASGSKDTTVRLWEIDTGKGLVDDTEPVLSVAFNSDGHTLATGSYDGAVRLWDLRTGSTEELLPAHKSSVASVAFNPDGTILATGSYDGTARLWDVADRKPAGDPLRDHTDSVVAVAFSSHGNTLATGSIDATAQLWDADNGKNLDRPMGHSDTVGAVAFSPDGKVLATGSTDNTVRLWEVRTRALKDTLTGHTGPVNSVAFSAAGQHTLATASNDNTVRLWDMQTGERRTLPGHVQGVSSVAFSSDGILATGSHDQTVRLWDVKEGKPLATLPQLSMPSSLAFSPDGSTLAIGDDGGAVRIHDLGNRLDRAQWHDEIKDAIDDICRTLNRDLTSDERTAYLSGQSDGSACPAPEPAPPPGAKLAP